MRQAFYYSVASAAVAGLLFGGVLKLGPDALADTGGPQILITGAGKRAIAQEDGFGGVLFASRNGEIPEHVIGTDWAQPVDLEPVADVYEYEYAEAATEPAPEVDHAAFAAPVKISAPPALKPVSYPSIDGDVVGEREARDTALTEVVEAQEQEPQYLPS